MSLLGCVLVETKLGNHDCALEHGAALLLAWLKWSSLLCKCATSRPWTAAIKGSNEKAGTLHSTKSRQSENKMLKIMCAASEEQNNVFFCLDSIPKGISPLWSHWHADIKRSLQQKMPLQRASLNGKGIEGGTHRILLHKCTANKRHSTTNLKWRSVGTSFFDKTLFGYLFNKWIIERCNWQTEQITSWNVWIFQYYNRWLRLNCLQYKWQRILTKRAAGARSRAKFQVLWPCCALVVLGALGDSLFLVRGFI